MIFFTVSFLSELFAQVKGATCMPSEAGYALPLILPRLAFVLHWIVARHKAGTSKPAPAGENSLICQGVFLDL